jgi:MGT family glycosyltransferase
MAKYVILTAPGYGHINPTLPVARELVARGQEVVYYLPEQWRAAVDATGAALRTYQGSFAGPGPQTGAGQTPGFSVFVEESRRVLPQVLEPIRVERPDYILYDNLCFWGRIVARKLGVPAIRLHPSYAMNEQSMGMLMRTFGAQGGPFGGGFQEGLERLFRESGMPEASPREIFSPEPLNVIFMPRAFQPAGETFDERFLFVGPAIAPRGNPGGFPLDQLDQAPLLYISLGTFFNDRADFFNVCFAAFADWPGKVVLARGERIDPEALGAAPANFLVAPWVPQLEVLPRTQVFLTHGGMGSTMEGLYHGVPLVVVPQMPEQEITARRVEQLGLGLRLKLEEIGATALREAVRRVGEEPSFRARAREMQKVCLAAGGYQRAVEAILQLDRSRGT